ncbi:hypothetical protein BC351_28045 [Paenibacillus ferrarius]|uniref:SLH domain-containing protein n=1 Tax=Paenibacillus ferrarius TaxID=1469647 RepID=A0A1V4HIZ2_9BACL|nr:immunoglobulin-like domain-containing protein [Paenibacillus ferrarius]OPH56354.1 hypothetical protein BC351_28045 [Paenibacillus ferrarius]
MFTKELKRFIAVTTLATLMIGQAFPAPNAHAVAADKIFDILQIPDLHGRLTDNDKHPIAAVMARNIEEIKAQNPDRTLVLGGGDNYAGTNISEWSLGTAVMKVFNAMGMEASTLGNHEFDWGLDPITKNVPAQYPMLAANLYDKNTDQPVLDSYKVFVKDGVKIAIIGAVTQDTQYALPGTVDAYNIKDVADEVNKAAVKARADGARIVVANIHEEFSEENDFSGPIIDITNKLVGVDAVLGAHAHRNLKTTVNNIPLIIGRDRGKDLVQMKITLAANDTLSFDYNSLPQDTGSMSFPYGYNASNPVISTSTQQVIDDLYTQYAEGSHFTFDETSGTEASNSVVGGVKKASLKNGAAWKSGLNAGGIDLDGQGGYVSLPMGVPENTDNFTVATWVKIDQRNQWSRIFDFGSGESGNKNSFALTIDNDGYFLFYNYNGNQNGFHIGNVPAGVWTHVAVVVAGTKATVYVDGKDSGSYTFPDKPSALTTKYNYLGKPQAGTDPYFDGQFDDFYLYGRALDAGAVQALVAEQAGNLLEVEKSALSLGDVNQVIRNVNLPLSAGNGTKISWSSNNASVIDNEGNVHRPAAGSGDATVILTATLAKGNATATKPFTVKVKPTNAKTGKWLTGEFHTHTFESDDAQVSLTDTLENAFTKYGLDWLATANHLRSSGRDDEGTKVPSGPIPYSKGAINYEVPKVNAIQNAGSYSNKTIFSGFEWDIPTHDHAAIGILTDTPGSSKALKAANQFEYLFTKEPENMFDDNDVAEWKKAPGPAKGFSTHADALTAINWLKYNFAEKSYFLVTHPSRGKNGDTPRTTIADLRDFNNAAPNVNFGFEGMIGGQMEPDRGGYNTTYNVNNPTADNNYKFRSFGGTDYMVAKVGGVWDALLGEGRNYWNFANSDFHFKTINPNSSGYWPGEYAKNYTWTNGTEMQDIVNGMRSGKSFSVYGDLINALDFNIKGNGSKLEMGALDPSVSVVEGDHLQLTIRFKSPTTNNYEKPVDSGKSAKVAPKVDHIDLIAGDVSDEKAAAGTAEYNKDTNDSTKVIASFTSKDWTTDSEEYNVITYDLGSAGKKQYYRLRGTNLGLNVSGETDAAGNPLLDPITNDADNITRFNNINDRNYKDLWFYSNPIFVAPISAVTDTLNKLTLGDLNDVKTDIQLPTTGDQGVTIAWESSMPSLISNSGKLLAKPANNTMFTLTATVKNGEISKTKSFPGIIKGTNQATVELHGKMTTEDGKLYTGGTWTNQNVTVSVYANVYAPSTSAALQLSMNGDSEQAYQHYDSNSYVNISKEGENQLYFRATDNLGNQDKLPLMVKIDKEIPVITLNGESSIRLAKGSVYTEQKAAAKDNVGIAGDVVITGTVDTNQLGTYQIAYNVSDLAGNAAKEVIRTVVVYKESDSDPTSPTTPTPTPEHGSPATSDPAPKPETKEQTVQLDVKAAQGSEGSIKDVVKFKLPADALPSDGKVTVSVIPADQTPAVGNLQALSQVLEFTSTSGHTFNKPIEISINYKKDSNSSKIKHAAVYYYNELQKKWIFIGGTPKDDGTVTVQVNHFTKFAVFNYEPTLFKDLTGHWASVYTDRLIGMKAIQGFEDQAFHPEETVTRAQFASILVKSLGLQASTGAENFADESQIPAWAKADVAAAVKAGYISGYEENSAKVFKANQTITRAEMSVMIANALKTNVKKADAGMKSFQDAANIPDWAKASVSAAVSEGILKGYEDNTFRANNVATRAEAAAMIYKLLEALKI